MAHLHLPAQHDNDDIVLAHRLTQALECTELFVTWTHGKGPGHRPEVHAHVQERAGLLLEAIARLVAWIGTRPRTTA